MAAARGASRIYFAVMDRRVKERLIGASILVALAVLVVPELLSGPRPVAPAPILAAMAPEPTRNVTVDLATSKTPTTSETQTGGTSGAPAPASAAGTSAAGTSSAVAATAAAFETAARPPTAAAVETAVPPPISSRVSWAVQLGSFASRANADNLTRQLKGQGLSVYVLPGGSGASVRYRVRIGPLADRDSAERMAAKLKSIGHDSSLVAPAG
jgi:DedD protein